MQAGQETMPGLLDALRGGRAPAQVVPVLPVPLVPVPVPPSVDPLVDPVSVVPSVVPVSVVPPLVVVLGSDVVEPVSVLPSLELELELSGSVVSLPGYGYAQIPRSATQSIPRGQLSPPEQSSTQTLVVSSSSLLHRTGASPSPAGAGQQLQSMKHPRVHTAYSAPSLKHWPPPPQRPGHGS